MLAGWLAIDFDSYDLGDYCAGIVLVCLALPSQSPRRWNRYLFLKLFKFFLNQSSVVDTDFINSAVEIVLTSLKRAYGDAAI